MTHRGIGLMKLGALAVALVLALGACDLTGEDTGLLDGDVGSEVEDLGIAWTGDEFELTGTVSELDEGPEALTVTYPTEEGNEETVLVAVPDGVLTPDLDEGDLVVIRGTRDEAGVLSAREIERVGPRGMAGGSV